MVVLARYLGIFAIARMVIETEHNRHADIRRTFA